MFKGTQVDGIYDKDPRANDDAVRYDSISYDEFLQKNLKVMDASAVALARDNNLPIVVFSLNDKGGLKGIISGQGTMTVVGQS
jgi:uridylate kinase